MRVCLPGRKGILAAVLLLVPIQSRAEVICIRGTKLTVRARCVRGETIASANSFRPSDARCFTYSQTPTLDAGQTAQFAIGCGGSYVLTTSASHADSSDAVMIGSQFVDSDAGRKVAYTWRAVGQTIVTVEAQCCH